jgi:hypothetical protein
MEHFLLLPLLFPLLLLILHSFFPLFTDQNHLVLLPKIPSSTPSSPFYYLIYRQFFLHLFFLSFYLSNFPLSLCSLSVAPVFPFVSKVNVYKCQVDKEIYSTLSIVPQQ